MIPYRLPLLIVATVITACASNEFYQGGYWWVVDPQAKHCAASEIVWKKVEAARTPGLCAGKDGVAAHANTSCALGCLIVSPYSKEQAMNIKLGRDDNLYAHEVRHAKDGLVHP